MASEWAKCNIHKIQFEIPHCPKCEDEKAQRIKLETLLKEQELSHDKGEDCEHDDCQDCCGEFYGHEYDFDEGGYCMCGYNGYENGE